MPASIDDIMKRSGLGRATVYRALAGANPVSERTRDRVLAAAAELGRPVLRRRTRSSCRLAVWVPGLGRLASYMHHASIISSVEAVATERGLSIEMLSAPLHEEAAETARMVRRAKVSGVMVVSLYSEAHLAALASELPVVLFFSPGQCEGVTTVAPDDFSAGYLATRHLIEQGHERIAAVVGGGQRPVGFSQRFTGGYALALAEAQLPWRDALVLRDSANLGPFSGDRPAPPACGQIMKLRPRPTAAIGRAETVLGLSRGLALEGVSVPGDMVMAGYGPAGGEPWPLPGCPWVEYSPRAAAEAGLDALRSRSRTYRTVTIPVSLAPAAPGRTASK